MNKVKGFTLIEVLVASFILFLVISSASLIFNSTVKSKGVATESLQLYGYVPLLMDHIAVQVRRDNSLTSKDEKSGDLFGIRYQWVAQLKERMPVESRNDGSVESQFEGLLWSVQLTVFTKEKFEHFQFSVVSWQPL